MEDRGDDGRDVVMEDFGGMERVEGGWVGVEIEREG